MNTSMRPFSSSEDEEGLIRLSEGRPVLLRVRLIIWITFLRAFLLLVRKIWWIRLFGLERFERRLLCEFFTCSWIGWILLRLF